MESLTLLPAYGRDYKSAKAVKADYLNGKDFQHAFTGSYCSSRDFINQTVVLRYNRLMSVTTCKLTHIESAWQEDKKTGKTNLWKA